MTTNTFNPKDIKYDIEAAITVTPGQWSYNEDDEYYGGLNTIRMNGHVIAEVRESKGTQFNGLEPRPERTKANGVLMAASKDMAQALVGAYCALAMLQQDPEASVAIDFHLNEINNALTRAGFPEREVEAERYPHDTKTCTICFNAQRTGLPTDQHVAIGHDGRIEV
jgi:hypothetical protein